MLRIRSLELVNIRTFQKQSVDFSDGINIVYGENGAGKTTLLQAILGSLLGFRQATRTGTQIHDLIRDGKKLGKIQLCFSIDEKDYRVVATLKLNKQEIRVQKLSSQGFWEDLAGPKVSEFEREMENLLGISIDILNRVIYCPQNELTKIISSQVKDRKDVFERLLGINKYRIAEANARELIRQGNLELEKIEDRMKKSQEFLEELPKIQERIADCVEKIRRAKQRVKHLKEKTDSIEKAYEQMSKKKEQYDQLIGRIVELKKTIKTIEEELEKTQHNLTKKKGTLALDDTDLEQIENLIQEAELNYQKQEELDSRKSREVGTLSQKIADKQENEKKLAKARRRIKSLKAEIKQLIPTIREYSEAEIKKLESRKRAEADQVRKTLDEIKSKISLEQAREKQLRERITELRNEISLLEEKAKSSRGTLGELSKWELNRFDKVVLLLEEQIEEKQRELDNVKYQITVTEEKIARISNEIGETRERISLLKKEKEAICPVCKKQLTGEERDRLIEKYELELKKKEEESASLQDELQQLKPTESRLPEEIDSLKEQQKELQTQKKMREQLEEFVNKLKDLQAEQEDLQRELDRLNLEELYEQQNAWETSLDEQEISLKALREADGKRIELDNYLRQVAELESKLKAIKEPIESQLQEIQAELSAIKVKKKECKKRIKELGEIKELLGDINKLKQRISTKKRELHERNQELQILDFSHERFKEIEEQQKATLEELKGAQKDLEHLANEVLPDLKERERSLKELREELKQDQARKIKYERLLRMLETSKSIFKEFPEHIAEIRLSNAQERANQIIRRFFEDRDIDGLQIRHQKYEIKAIRSGKPESVERLSGGEQAVLALSLRISLLEEMGQLGLMLLDEPTSALDQTRIEEFVSFLEESRIFQQLILVTHREEFLQSADNPIQIKRQFDSSTISSWEFAERT